MKRDVFICSAGHSGSTLLDMMLGSHPRCESIGELVHLPMDMATNRICTCGQPMNDCSLWPEVMRRMGVDPLLDPYALNLGYVIAKVGDRRRTSKLHQLITRPKNALKYAELRYELDWLRALTPAFTDGIANTQRVYEHIRALTGKDLVVDSSKHYLRAVELYRKQPDTTRIVLLVRDGRGVYYSGLKRGFGRHYSLRAWNKHYRRTMTLLQKHVPEDRRITVRYEDLVENTTAALERLCHFLGIDFTESMLDFRTAVHHNVNGNDMKFASASELKLDVAWKSQLKADDLAYFERQAGVLNREFGYL